MLSIASGIRKHFTSDEAERLTSAVEKFKDYPLHFEEHSGFDEEMQSKIKELHAGQNFDLQIADNVRPEDCRRLKTLAKELNVAVLALMPLYSKKDEILSRGIADSFVTFIRDRETAKTACGETPVEFIVSKKQEWNLRDLPLVFYSANHAF